MEERAYLVSQRTCAGVHGVGPDQDVNQVNGRTCKLAERLLSAAGLRACVPAYVRACMCACVCVRARLINSLTEFNDRFINHLWIIRNA